MSRSSSGSNDSNSDDNIDVVEAPEEAGPQSNIDKNDNKEEVKSDKSDLEEGQVTSSGDSDDNDTSDDSGESVFNDGFDDNLMGDERDRSRLEALSEKERETEIFKRIERRDVMRTRWEIEKKLKQAKRVERAKDKPIDDITDKRRREERKQLKVKASTAIIEPAVRAMSAGHSPIIPKAIPVTVRRDEERMLVDYGSDDAPEYFDPKERSKERKKNVEMNRTDDKRSNAMALLKARREGKQKRGKKRNILLFLF